MAQETKAIVQYQVRQGDSLEKLCLRFMQDAEAWLQVAILNALDYPYITDDADFVREAAASGEVVFSRSTGSTGDITIPMGYIVTAPATAASGTKDYRTTATALIPDGQSSASAPVESTVVGEFGNTAGLTVTLLSTSIADLEGVSNPAAIVGGQRLNVKIPGDYLLLFTDQDGLSATSSLNTEALGRQENFFASLLGVDIALDRTGDLLADSQGDYALVAGVENFRQALLRRFNTPLAWYVFNPGYGSDVERVIGQRGDSYWLQRARIAAERTVRSDPRTANVQNIQVTFSGGALAISMDIIAIGEKDPKNLVVSFQTGG